MVRDNRLPFPGADAIRSRIDATTRAERNVYLDALAIADGLLRNHMAANIVVIGAAYQAGALPISAASIEKAIELNGTAVAMNIAAFRWGRAVVADPVAVEAGLRAAGRGQRSGEPAQPAARGPQPEIETLLRDAQLAPDVERLVRQRASELVAYQDVELAKRYVAFVRRVAEAEVRAMPGQCRFSEAVARYLYKLMAYKDEYEVARLFLDPRFEQQLAAQFPEGGEITYHLHPPMLRALGMDKKLKLPADFRLAFQALYAMRRLRGTPLDPFGYAEVRRVERELIGDYARRVRQAAERLTPESYDQAVTLAELPDKVRGYEHIKLRNVEQYRAALADLERGGVSAAAG
jgi:indolepyruvate ferredoxin oxidoreductase